MVEMDLYRGLIEGMRCAILAADREGRLVVCNELAVQILGLPDVPRPYAPLAEVLDGHPELIRLLTECFAMEILPNREELAVHSAAGPRRIGYTLSLIGSPGSEPAGAAVFFKDLTLIEQREEQERLRDRLAALGQMAASLAHEIRNPLASIEVTCSLLRRRLGGDEQSRGMLDKITAEVRRLNRTMTSSLEFVRPVSLQRAETGLAPLLREAVQVATDRSGSKAIAVELRVADEIPEFLMDRARLRQVFENLVLNALEAVHRQGRVRISAELIPAPASAGPETSEIETWVEVQVADSGEGINDEDLDHIFHPFFTSKEHGSGVGLSMAKKIVDCHRGRIGVEKAPEGGAQFTVRLPLDRASRRSSNR